MHGIILSTLNKYVNTAFEPGAWNSMLKSAGLEGHVYLPSKMYPDAEAMALIDAAVVFTGQPSKLILERFGEFLAPILLTVYQALLNANWRTLDVVEAAEHTIHRVVRMKDADSEPPKLKCERSSPGEVIFTYESPRRLCGVAIGIVRGLAKRFDEIVEIAELQCVHQGDRACKVRIRLSE